MTLHRSPIRAQLPFPGPLVGKWGADYDYAANLFPLGTEKGLLILAKDTTRLYTTSGGSTNAVNHGDRVGRAEDGSGTAAIDLIQATADNRATLQIVDGVYSLSFDGSSDSLAKVISAADLDADSTIIMSLKTSDNQFMLAGGQASYYFGAVEDGSASTAINNGAAGTPTYWDAGTQISSPNRDDMHTNLVTGGWVIPIIKNIVLDAATEFHMGNYSGIRLNGEIGHLFVVPSGANLDAQLSNTIAQIQKDVGL